MLDEAQGVDEVDAPGHVGDGERVQESEKGEEVCVEEAKDEWEVGERQHEV